MKLHPFILPKHFCALLRAVRITTVVLLVTENTWDLKIRTERVRHHANSANGMTHIRTYMGRRKGDAATGQVPDRLKLDSDDVMCLVNTRTPLKMFARAAGATHETQRRFKMV